jgi:hypothetical protein
MMTVVMLNAKSRFSDRMIILSVKMVDVVMLSVGKLSFVILSVSHYAE